MKKNRLAEHANSANSQKPELIETYEYTQVLLDAMPLSTHLWDKNFNLIDCNDENNKLFNVSSKKELLDHFFDFSPEYQSDGQLSSEKALKYIKKAFEEGRTSFEWMHKRLDNTPLPTQVTLVRIRLKNEYFVTSYVQDLRNHKQMLKKIEQHEKLLRMANNAASVLLSTNNADDFEASLKKGMEYMGLCLDVDRVQIWQNQMIDGELHFILKFQWLSEYGRQTASPPVFTAQPYRKTPGWEMRFSHNEYINSPISALSPEDQKSLGPFEIKSIILFPLFIQNQFWGFFSFDDCHHERTFAEDEIDIVRSGCLMMVNVLHRNTQTIQLNQARERTQVLLDAMPLTCRLWQRGSESPFFCNEEAVKIFKAKDKDDYIKRYFDLLPEYQSDGQLSKEKIMDYLNKAFDEGRYTFEWTSKAADGELIPSEVTFVRVKYGDENVIAGYSRDLREYKQMMHEIEKMTLSLHASAEQLEAALKEAQQANNAKSGFLARMSHEMRTPLNAIIGLSELTLSTRSLDEESLSNLKKINNAGITLLSTVNDILDISKIEAGKFELLPAEYDMPSLLNDAITQSIMYIGEKPIQFLLNIDENLPACLYGDDLRIKQIFNNLLSNAFKYTREGEVELSVYCARDEADASSVWINICVRDTGVGIRREELNKLFNDYAKMDLKSNRYIEGTGLGLNITKGIVEMMDGSISVESEHGKGSVFKVSLKQKLVNGSVIGAKVADSLKKLRYSDQKHRGNSMIKRASLPYARVLVVDDVETNLVVAKGMMKPYGMQIDCVTSGEMAIEAIREEKVKYNAVFMDQMMPGMNGIEAARIIREEIGTEYAKTVPMIALTANAIIGSEEIFLKNGFQAFISKPIEMERLDAVIREWVRDKDFERTLEKYNDKGQLILDIGSGRDKRGIHDRRSGFDRRLSGKRLKGVDLDRGILNFGGDEETYLQVLHTFVTDTRHHLDSILSVTKDSLAEYAIAVHGIKGACWGICAGPAGAKAESLEKAAKNGNYDYVAANNQNFIETIEELLDNLNDHLKSLVPEYAGSV